MFIWWVISVLLMAFALGCSQRSSEPAERGSMQAEVTSILTNLLIPEKTFLSIPDGASFETVTNMLGNTAWHGFTIAETNCVYKMISCLVDVGDGIDFWLLFRDRTLVKIIQRPRGESVRIPYRGTTMTRPKSWDVEDKSYIWKNVNAPAMTHDQIKAYLDWLRPDKGTAGKPANIMPAFLLTQFFEKTWGRTKKDYETNQELRKRYDGCRASLGMTIEQVDALYGNPLRVFTTKDGQPVRIYGDNRHLDINPQYLFSCVAVVFDVDGRVTNIYSRGFFNNEWKE